MKRVLFVDHVDRILGGAEINLIELIEEALRHTDWNIAVACRRNSMLGDAIAELGVAQFDYGFGQSLNKLRFAGRAVSWQSLPGAIFSLMFARSRLAQIGKAFKPSAVVSCTNKDHFASIAAFRGAQRLWWVNDLITPEFFSGGVRTAFGTLLNLGPGLVAVSDCVKDALIKLGADPLQIRVIHNGIPLERYRRSRSGLLRERLGIPKGEPLFGIVGRIAQWKGHHIFVELANAWIQNGLPGHFVVIGKAFNEDQDYETSVREGANARIHFAGATKDVAAALSDLDALLHTSIKPEPFGRVLIEAMAVGTPVIAADAGGPREVIKDDVDGLLARPGDVMDYGRKLRLIATDAELRKRITARARQTVEQRFTIQRTVRDFNALLTSPRKSR